MLPSIAWGSDKYLDTKCMIKTIIKTAGGARKKTWVYVVVGKNPGPWAHGRGSWGHHSACIQKECSRNTSGTSASQPGSGGGVKVTPEKEQLYHILEAGKIEADSIVHESIVGSSLTG